MSKRRLNPSTRKMICQRSGEPARNQIDDPAEILEQMADDCRVHAANAGCITADDLELIGWTPEQIELHGRAAARRATQLAAA